VTGSGFIANISCRNGCDGTDVADHVWYMSDSGSLDDLDEFVLLVHGYNDHRSYAECAYSQFLNMCNSVSNGGFSYKYKVAKLHWPGDQTNSLKGDVDYPASLQHAIGSGAILATFLHGLATTQMAKGNVLRIHWVAHSLGNRLVLETIAALRKTNITIQFPTFAMMAPAVRSNVLDIDSDLRAAALTPESTSSLHSTGDRVLEWAFPPGQTISGDGFFPEALGRHGNPLQLTANTQSFNWFGHSDYWFSPYSVAYALSSMGIVIDRRTIPNDTADHVPPPANTTPANDTPTRATPVWIPAGKVSKFKNPC
jgi:Alpha/beta hydrolase of unknown function (DUF900)